jgi:cytochrome c peroxidase
MLAQFIELTSQAKVITSLSRRRSAQLKRRAYSVSAIKWLFLLLLPLNLTWANTPPLLTDSDFHPSSELQAELGRLLFYDNILSGNRNISCGTCHHPAFGTSDGFSLGVGEGGVGLGPTRTAGEGSSRIERRVPRNAPALWNLGAKEISVLMHDGRISVSDIYGNGFNTPAQEWLPSGLASVVAAQALFPLTSETEMAGGNEENEVSGAANDRIDNAWPIIAKRVRTIPAYAERFIQAFDSVTRAEDVTIVHIANALAAFITSEFRSDDSAFDQWLAGDENALDEQQHRGRELFYGKATCHTCHSGPLFSSHAFKALALPPFGPGRTRQFDPIVRDVGRMGESDRLDDAYRFRVPMLRNVALTAPYGHNGAFNTLDAMIKHHIDPEASVTNWSTSTPVLADAPWLSGLDFIVWQDKFEMQRQRRKVDIVLPELNDSEVGELVAFLRALTGRGAAEGESVVPLEVPSGLGVVR